jgi:hypothetical protein
MPAHTDLYYGCFKKNQRLRVLENDQEPLMQIDLYGNLKAFEDGGD